MTILGDLEIAHPPEEKADDVRFCLFLFSPIMNSVFIKTIGKQI